MDGMKRRGQEPVPENLEWSERQSRPKIRKQIEHDRTKK